MRRFWRTCSSVPGFAAAAALASALVCSPALAITTNPTVIPPEVSEESKRGWEDKSRRDAAEPLPLLQLRPEAEADALQRPAESEADAPRLQAQPSPLNVPAWVPFAGKLYMKTPDGVDHYCTAMFVEPNVILTAAHCVRQNGTGVDHTDFAFHPEAGNSFAISCFVVHNDWVATTNKHLRVRFDYAFMQTATALGSSPSHKPTVRNPYREDVDILGYPAAGLTIISGGVGQDVLFPRLVWLRSDQTAFTMGTSGGPWVDAIPNRKRIYSVNSSYGPVLYNDDYINIYGPRFDDQMPLYLAAARNQNCNPL